MKDFYLTLLSASYLQMYPDNKQKSFIVKLDYPIQTEKKKKKKKKKKKTGGSCVGRNDHAFANF